LPATEGNLHLLFSADACAEPLFLDDFELPTSAQGKFSTNVISIGAHQVRCEENGAEVFSFDFEIPEGEGEFYVLGGADAQHYEIFNESSEMITVVGYHPTGSRVLKWPNGSAPEERGVWLTNANATGSFFYSEENLETEFCFCLDNDEDMNCDNGLVNGFEITSWDLVNPFRKNVVFVVEDYITEGTLIGEQMSIYHQEENSPREKAANCILYYED